MQSKQRGFAAQGALILLVVVLVIVGAGYVVVKRQNKQLNSEGTKVSNTVQKIIPVDGTPKSAVSEISSQLSKEIKIDDDSLRDEENESTSVDSSVVSGVEGALHEKNL